MKAIIIIAAVVIFILFLFQSYVLMSANKTEEQKYTVIRNFFDTHHLYIQISSN